MGAGMCMPRCCIMCRYFSSGGPWCDREGSIPILSPSSDLIDVLTNIILIVIRPEVCTVLKGEYISYVKWKRSLGRAHRWSNDLRKYPSCYLHSLVAGAGQYFWDALMVQDHLRMRSMAACLNGGITLLNLSKPLQKLDLMLRIWSSSQVRLLELHSLTLTSEKFTPQPELTSEGHVLESLNFQAQWLLHRFHMKDTD